MQIVKPDIRDYKNKLRTKYKSIRTSMTYEYKSKLDNDVFNRLILLKEYKKANIILTFVSTDIEVDTHKLIKYSLEQGKKVAVPKCISGTRNMSFYLIESFDDLEVATFSVLEPKTDKCMILKDFENSICIVPGLAFDLNGYRLGYGKGYYDRFLTRYNGTTIGICYCSCTLNKLIKGKFDRNVDILITDKFIHRTFS